MAIAGQRCDYIIVGFGLAGCALTVSLLDQGKSVAVVEDPLLPSSSRVAAGLYNPVTGRKMVKTWKADLLFPALRSFYQELETRTGQSFLVERPIYRPFIGLDEQNDWWGKSAGDAFKAFIDTVHTKTQLGWTKDPFGGVVLSQCGYLDIPKYLDTMRSYLQSKVLWIPEKFHYEEAFEDEGGVSYRNIRAGKIVFCEGTGVEGNPWFRWVPFSPVKGEILDIEMAVSSDWIVNRGVFILRTGDNLFRVGSTYDNHDLSWEISGKGKENICERLDTLVSVNYEVVGQHAGVRPASRDRRPVIGKHPEKETFAVFNGLGTKGVSLSPFYAKQLAGYLEGKNDLDKEVNVSRYFSLY